jgi:hypothetical protein
MIRTTVATLLLTAFPAQAQNFESMQRANELGAVLAAEKLCDLTLNQAGIEAWVTKNVASDDMSFANNLLLMTQGAEYQARSMSDAGRTAHCTAVRQSARTMGLID